MFMCVHVHASAATVQMKCALTYCVVALVFDFNIKQELQWFVLFSYSLSLCPLLSLDL